MVPASQMRAGMAIVFENQTYRVVGGDGGDELFAGYDRFQKVES